MVREKEGYQSFSPLFLFNFGLGGVAELEVNSIGTLTNIGRGVLNVPATSVKVRLWKEKLYIPSISVLFRTWPFYSQQIECIKVDDTTQTYRYLYRAGTLYGIVSKRIKETTIIGGVKITDNRYKIVPQGEDEKKINEEQMVSYSGVAGIVYPVNNATLLMIEYQNLPVYHFSPEKMQILSRHTLMIGVRFFFIPEISIDAAGVITSQEFRGIADTIIHTNLNVSFYAVDGWNFISKTCPGG